MRRKKIKRPHLLLLLSTLCLGAAGFCCLLQFYGYRLVDLMQLEPYENAKVPFARVERVPVNDVLAVREFIVTGSTPQRVTYYYNKARSDRVGAFRALPDTRDAICATRSYRIWPKNVRVSVIISFHNEARSTLVRTIMSIYRRTPARYLHELILIDDCSMDVNLLPSLLQLDMPPFQHNRSSSTTTARTVGVTIKTLRNWQRAGVIASRNHGARLATGDYLLFLDSHCEVNVGWLEPLLERVTASTCNAASPLLDSIDAATLDYVASSKRLMGGFDWNLHFHWVPRQQRQHMQSATPTAIDTEAFKSPTFAGGIFMISRNCFFKLNAFNPLLLTWGGESIEFSIKLWLCGGHIEIVPCSRVGHIFRKQHPFAFPDGDNGQATYLRNAKIIAESWLDDYKHFFYASKPAAKQMSTNVTLNAITQLKHHLRCQPFRWYLENVFPQLKLPNDDFIAFGTLSSVERCLHAPTGGQLAMVSCYTYGITRWFLHRQTMQLRTGAGECLSVLQSKSSKRKLNAIAQLRVVLEACEESAQLLEGQRWLRRGAQLMHQHSQLCLDNPLSDTLTMSHCRSLAPTQLFRFTMERQLLKDER